MRGSIAAICAGLAIAMLCAADKPAKPVEFLGTEQLSYAMAYTDAQASLSKGEKDWTVLYSVDTPSTSEFAWVWQEREFYLLRFYQGLCYFVERRAEVSGNEVETIFNYYTTQHGETSEGTMSDDRSLWYSHWLLKDRDIELTATKREGELYLVTYQEFDPVLLGEALRVQESELGNAPMEIDPVTGKPRPATHTVEGSEGDGSQGGQGEASPGDDQGGDNQDGDDGDEQAPPPPPPDDDDESWY